MAVILTIWNSFIVIIRYLLMWFPYHCDFFLDSFIKLSTIHCLPNEHWNVLNIKDVYILYTSHCCHFVVANRFFSGAFHIHQSVTFVLNFVDLTAKTLFRAFKTYSAFLPPILPILMPFECLIKFCITLFDGILLYPTGTTRVFVTLNNDNNSS